MMRLEHSAVVRGREHLEHGCAVPLLGEPDTHVKGHICMADAQFAVAKCFARNLDSWKVENMPSLELGAKEQEEFQLMEWHQLCGILSRPRG